MRSLCLHWSAWVAASLLVGCSRADIGKRPPDLVLLVLDTLRVDRTSLEGGPAHTPFLEEFAAQGTHFRRAYSTSCWTLPAHASMFSGALPDTHGADQDGTRVSADLPLLAERLAEAGYQTAAFTQNPWVSARTGLESGFEHLGELWPGNVSQPGAAGPRPVVDEVRDWLTNSRDAQRPLFLFVNVIKPHAPYTPARAHALRHFPDESTWVDAQRRFASGPRDLIDRVYGRGEPLTSADWSEVGALYAAELEQTDDIARRLVGSVDAVCDPANALVLIVADHGEHLGEGGHTSHMFVLSEELTRVLCLARGAGFAPGLSDRRPRQLQDVYATFLGAAGVRSDAPLARDLRSPVEAERVLLTRIAQPRLWLDLFPDELRDSPRLKPFLREVWAAQDERYKWVVEDGLGERLFDLEGPGKERTPIDPGQVDAARLVRLKGAVAASRQRAAMRQQAPDDSFEAGDLEALRALGYVR